MDALVFAYEVGLRIVILEVDSQLLATALICKETDLSRVGHMKQSLCLAILAEQM